MLFKRFYIALLFLVAIVQTSFSQEIDFSLRYGIPTNRFKPFYSGDQKPQLMNLRSVSDFTLVADYKIPLKFDVNYFFGLEVGTTRGYLPIIGWGGDSRLLENIIYNNQRISLRWFGLEKRFNLIDEKLWLSANIVLLSRFYLGNEKRYASDYKSNNEDWIEYKYDIRLYNNKVDKSIGINFFDLYLSSELGLKLYGKMTKNLAWNFNIAYYRNVYTLYNYDIDLQYYYNGEDVPHDIYTYTWNQSFDDPKLIQREHYFAVGFGMSYAF